MKRFCIYITFVLSVFALAAGCTDRNELYPNNTPNGYISPYCYIESTSAGTKALIDQTTNADSLFCNFLRIDNTSKTDPWSVDWRDSYVSEGSISTSAPGGSPYLRTISMFPPQPYHSVEEIVSRMVGWYPRNIDLPEDVNDEDISTKANNFTSTIVSGEDYIGIKFTGLNGSKDIMVSNVLDGSVNDPFDSEKFFRFKHYLSAIKIYAKAENSSQDIGIWGDISNVIIMGQPTSCEVSLPETSGNDSFGEVKKWGTENAKLPITTSPIFGPYDIGNNGNIEAEEYPISLDSGNAEKYLGYSLIKPIVKVNDTLKIQIHTSAGVYEVNINETLEAGYLYELHLDFKTDNTIHSYLSIIGNEKYLDLTTLEAYQPDPESSTTYTYKYANCYMIYSDPSGTDQDPDIEIDSDTYDGFCFDATVVGNGDKGMISEGAQHMYPRNTNIKPFSADILWETSPRLITQVELIYGYIRFKVAKNNDGKFKEGNAVLVAYDENKNILWSWHIWITDKPEEITYTEGSTSITILDRNIGATAAHWDGTDPNSGTPLETFGLYYQWGRKDPSMGPPEWDYSPINMTTAPYYDYSSDTYHAANVMRFESPTLKDAVENPMYLIMPTSQTQTYYFNWLGEKIDFLWGYNSEKGTTQKTIYDPCPYGYRVSGGELADLFSYATSTTSNDINITRTDYGQIVNISTDKFYFPYTGFKGVDRGLNSLVSSWRYVGQKGDYQSSIVSTYATDEEYFMHRSRVYISKERTWNELNVGDYTGYQIEDHTNRRTAAPVRCVKNEEHNRVMAFITPDKQYVANNSDKVTFTLYAHSFQTNISTATLSVGYHLKSNEEEHIDQEIDTWTPGTKEWNGSYTFDFSNLEDGEGNPLEDLSTTTGQFRFILHVKSNDNINKTSSTTITLLENDLIFQRWNTMDSTVFTGENIDRQVRIIGISKPTKVEMRKVYPNKAESDWIDISSGLSPNSTPEYPTDYLCSTNGKLSFSDKGWNYVYFRVTYESGNVVTYNTDNRHKKWFKVVSLTQISQTSEITEGSNYVIRNNNTKGYLYDNGNKIAPTSTITYNPLFFFQFDKTGSSYKIKNTGTGDYVRSSGTTLNISETNSNNATSFSIQNGFNIYNGSSYWGFQRTNSAEVSFRNNNSNRDWIIYRVDDSDISPTPNHLHHSPEHGHLRKGRGHVQVVR